MVITTSHNLLTGSWTADVEAAETAIKRFSSKRSSTDNCHVALFEIHGDELLHVNVTHGQPTKGVSGWAGPGIVPDGFVHNRTFGDTQSNQVIIRHIRDMVLAATT